MRRAVDRRASRSTLGSQPRDRMRRRERRWSNPQTGGPEPPGSEVEASGPVLGVDTCDQVGPAAGPPVLRLAFAVHPVADATDRVDPGGGGVPAQLAPQV